MAQTAGQATSRTKTLQEECEILLKRHKAPADSKEDRLGIYIRTLLGRFSSVDYSLTELQQFTHLIASATKSTTTENYAPFKNYEHKRDFYVDCFWSFSYSVFDILSHIVNMIHPAVKLTEESKVSFAGAGQGYTKLEKVARGPSEIPDKVRETMTKIRNRPYFKRLGRYRQCCLHRRAVCVRDEWQTVSYSMPYPTTTSKDESRIVSLICDDPDDMVPSFDKKRSLGDECAAIRKGIEEDVRKVIQVL